MKLSTRSRYGLRLMTNIAAVDHGNPVDLKTVAREEEVSMKYLERIVTPLKAAGLLQGYRGPGGGYRLGRPANRISAAEIVRILEGDINIVSCINDRGRCRHVDTCPTRPVWQNVNDAIYDALHSVSLANLTDKNKEDTP
jgi:Rrf2 family protein